MFFKNLLKTKKMVKKAYQFGGFKDQFSGGSETLNCYNFKIKDNALGTGYGFSGVVLPVDENQSMVRDVFVGSDVKCDLWHYHAYNLATGKREDRVMWSSEDGGLGYFDVMGYSQVSTKLETNFQELPTGINYVLDGQDCMLFSTSGSLMKFAVGENASQATALPKLVDLCFAYEKLWGIASGKQNKILYSDNVDITTWAESERSIILNDDQGACNKLVFYEDDLYVFRDFGITKISEYGTSRQYEVFSKYSTKSQIYAKTVVRCGEKILFLTKDGICSFNGQNVDRIFVDFDLVSGINNKNAVGAFDGKCYILACKILPSESAVGCEEYEGGYKNNALIFFNLETKEIDVMRGVDIRSIVYVACYGFTGLFATFYGEHSTKIGLLNQSGDLFGLQLPKVWESRALTFNSVGKTKNIRNVYILAYTDCILSVETDKEKQGFVVVGDDKLQEIKTFIKGGYVKVKILSNQGSKIYPPKIVFEEEKN